MHRITLTVDGTRYHLLDETDVDVLQRSVLRAVRRGGFLTFTPHGFTRVSVLVSRRSSILMETVEEIEASAAPVEHDRPVDYEMDFRVGRSDPLRYGT